MDFVGDVADDQTGEGEAEDGGDVDNRAVDLFFQGAPIGMILFISGTVGGGGVGAGTGAVTGAAEGLRGRIDRHFLAIHA